MSNNNPNNIPSTTPMTSDNIPNTNITQSNGHISSQQSSNNNILTKPSTTITRPPRNGSSNNQEDANNNSNNNSNNNNNNVVSNQDAYVHQMGLARNSNMTQSSSNNNTGGGTGKPDDYDPDSNVYVANLPSDYGKDRLYKLFGTYGQIVRYKFVTPDEPTQPGYGFVQFANRKDAHRAIKNLEGHVFTTGETIYLSIALRRRSSLSDEPTNLYVKNLPSSWTNDKLRKVFGAYGQIRQSKVVGDGIAFVRFEDHDQALNAIGRLDKQMVEQGCKLEVRFATRKTAANAYRLQQIPQTKTNENNLYIRNLPKYYNQSSLETLFANYGKISSAKINDNGIAFVRFAHAEDAKRAIQELNGKKPPQFEEEIVVKLAHFDIGDSRNRWANKFGGGSSSVNNMAPSTSNPGGHFNNNMYQNHFNAPIGSMNQYSQYTNGGGFHNNNGTPLPSVPSSQVSSDTNNAQHNNQDVNVSVNMNNPLNASITAQNQNQNMMQFGLNTQMQAIQQQMQQFNIANQQQQAVQQQQGNNTNVQLNQFAFPAATPVMMPAPTLFTQNLQQQQQQQIPTSLPRQVSNDSHHSLGSGAASPQSNHSGSSNDKAQTWSKKQQELGDQLYQKVHAKCGRNYAPKITGMLIKMGDKKAQQCIDDPAFLDQQIEIAKKLLETNEGVMPQSNGTTNNQLCVSSPTSMLQQHSSSPTTTTPLMNRLGQQFTNVNSPNGVHTGMNGVNRFQQLNTKPVTPNGVVNSPNSGITNTLTTPNQATLHPQQALLNPSLLTSSIPNLLTSSIPNSLYGAVPILSTPQLLAMSPAPASNTSGTPQPVSNGIHHMNGTTNGNITPNSNHHSKHIQQLNQHVQPQYLFTTMPNSLGIPNGVNVNNINGVVTSPGHQQIYSITPNGVQVVTTPNSLEQQHQQQQTIQQSGWGLALQQNPQINVIQTQPATQFMQPALYPKTQ